MRTGLNGSAEAVPFRLERAQLLQAAVGGWDATRQLVARQTNLHPGMRQPMRSLRLQHGKHASWNAP